jgi:DNA-binding transcriptional regulator YiaG
MKKMAKRARKDSFFIGGQKLAAQPYHYTACGLDGVYLLNGFTLHKTDYGHGVAVKNIDALHQAIGLQLVLHRKALSPRDFRFLRKLLDLTQNELGDVLGVDGQTVARYEKGETAISGPSDRLLRFIVILSLVPEADRAKLLTDILDVLKQGDDEVTSHPCVFKSTKEGWREAHL